LSWGAQPLFETMPHIIMQRRTRLLTAFAQQAAQAKPTPLDITEIRHFPVREPVSGNRYSLLRVTTRSGVTGWGESQYDPKADIKTLESAWVGRQASAYAAIPPSLPFRAALDMALLDILGKTAKVPVYRILGGPTRSKVRMYSHPYAEESVVALIDVPAPVSRNQGKAYQNRILELVNAVPSDRDFILAANGSLTPGDAASVATTVESKHPLWFDEPCSHSNVDALRKVSSESVVPLGFGANIDDPGIFQELLREGLIDLVRPDIGIFGINGTRRIAALAEPYYVAVAPRQNGGPIATAAAIHIAASIPNFFIQHVPLPAAEQDRAMRREMISPALETSKGGFLEVTNAPGLGITVNEAALEKYHAS
jgi:galactonate dehydratase